MIRSGEVVVDDATYTAKIGGRSLDLTFKEFELLKYLAQHPGRVFSRQQLLQEVWGYDYFGGTRTVDVHVRRLRAKLGPEHETLIGTVRNVGYRFVLPQSRRPPRRPARGSATPDGRLEPEPSYGSGDGRRSRATRGASIADAARRAADGAEPLDEGAWRRLRHHADELEVIVEPGAGFAVVDGDLLHLVVAPDAPRPGVGTRLLARGRSASAPATLAGLVARRPPGRGGAWRDVRASTGSASCG